MSNAIDISDDNFDSEVLESDKPVLIDFWAEWCGPCKVLGPVIDEVAVDYSDRVKFVKLNIDHNPNNTQKYGIRGIPTLILFKNCLLYTSPSPRDQRGSGLPAWA
mgnify:CR=1 FL=1